MYFVRTEDKKGTHKLRRYKNVFKLLTWNHESVYQDREKVFIKTALFNFLCAMYSRSKKHHMIIIFYRKIDSEKTEIAIRL